MLLNILFQKFVTNIKNIGNFYLNIAYANVSKAITLGIQMLSPETICKKHLWSSAGFPLEATAFLKNIPHDFRVNCLEKETKRKLA